MFVILQVATVFFVSIAWAQALAHALELPGKLRLDRDAYIATQSIYYPGFTIAGAFGEGLGMVSTLALLLVTGTGNPAFGWVLLAFLALLAMHAVYWLATHPTNKFRLKDQELRSVGAGFFALGGGKAIAAANPDAVWTVLRNRWEYSHVARAALAAIALLALVVATAI